MSVEDIKTKQVPINQDWRLVTHLAVDKIFIFFNPLPSGRCGNILKIMIFKLIMQNSSLGTCAVGLYMYTTAFIFCRILVKQITHFKSYDVDLVWSKSVL